MSTIQVQIPDSLQKSLDDLAARDGISIDQFISTAIAEKLSALMTENYLIERSKKGSREKYQAILTKVPDVEPEAYDRLPTVWHITAPDFLLDFDKAGEFNRLQSV